ncbi:hypothetical protein O181_045269 [Austropuccinia psidii MF-1]|uniref:Histidine kinase/HSP90-like ATPase domain-containing protein n=1 Tax=Austropuccinia psidii MF-1 TaxID=1389203 RepID=A0A9Q3HK83_9BASI|nr:hypothetical protein [Austropuccinia psidii MF-1]
MNLTKQKKLFAFITLSLVILNQLSSSSSSQVEDESPDDSNYQLPIVALKPDQEVFMSGNQEKFEYQSDIAKLMKLVVSHLYHDRYVFLRELISNSGDALEKLRFNSLTDPSALDTAPALNISIVADKPSKRLIIRDSGIGMTKEELQKNLGTIARSGTSEFLAKLEKSSDDQSSPSSSLIGQFGLGFYSSFLVADRVLVASKSNADEKQWVFESQADAAEFKISEDPRGNSLGRGTEITMFMKDDALDFLEVDKLKELISTHSEFSTTAPIYIWTEKDVEVPIEEESSEAKKEAENSDTPKEPKDKQTTEDNVSEEKESDQEKKDQQKEPKGEDEDTDEVKVDDDDSAKDLDGDDSAKDVDDNSDDKETKPKTKLVTKHEWEQVNTKGPIWVRDAKTVTDEEYVTFYHSLTNKDENPISWVHFKGDAGRTSFHGLIYIPDSLPTDFYAKTYAQLDSVRLFVRKVLITKEPSPEFIPKWLNWLKVIVDADDLPLNVGRDSLQVNKSLKQIQSIILKKFIDHLSTLAKNQPAKYKKLWARIGMTLKLGAVEDTKNREKLTKLLRFQSSQSDDSQVGLEEYVARRKKNQKQIYFIAGTGMEVKDLSKSPFVEKLVARGYEVLYLTEPMDEMITATLANFDGMKFQDVAKKGLEMGDEDDDEEEKKSLQAYKTQFEPLSKWIKDELSEHVSDVIISNRLTTSPCAIVTDSYAWTGNMERLMAAQSQAKGETSNFMLDFIKKSKRTFEVNPKHPLIKGLLNKVVEAGEDDSLKEDLKYVTRVLWDTSLVRSGFTVPDTITYFERIELLLRKIVGVNELEEVEVGEIKPAPPVEEGPLDPRPPKEESESDKIQINSDGTTQKNDPSKEQWQDWSKVKEQLKKDALTEEERKAVEESTSSPIEEIQENDDGEDDDDEENQEEEDKAFDFGKMGEGLADIEKLKEQIKKDFGGLKDEL